MKNKFDNGTDCWDMSDLTPMFEIVLIVGAGKTDKIEGRKNLPCQN